MDSKLGNLIKEKLDIPCVYRCAASRLAVHGHSSLCMACMARLGIWPRLGRTNAVLDVPAGTHVEAQPSPAACLLTLPLPAGVLCPIRNGL